MNSDFEPPQRGWSILVTVGGVLTAIGIIAGLELWSAHLHKNTSAPHTQIPSSARLVHSDPINLK
ncbi:hypothetical protein IFO70_33925 [Phormidium tenue FACHB-886]|nr:hypothetical protein [Phormidium tenue FACHB-886]